MRGVESFERRCSSSFPEVAQLEDGAVSGSVMAAASRARVAIDCCSACAHVERRQRWPELIDAAERLGGGAHRELGQLEHDLAAMADDPGTDPHQRYT